MTSLNTSRKVRLIFLVCYLSIAVGATLSHMHDADAFAGYDEHCASCQWTFHTPIAIGSDNNIPYSLTPTAPFPLAQANPSKHTAFSKQHGRSPPMNLS